MDVLNVVQGTQEWLQLRDKYRTASNAPVIMGDSKYTKRNEFLRSKVYGEEKEVSDFMQDIFAKGHKAEDDARPIIEGIIDRELYRTTGVRDKYLASFDGLTITNDLVFEHKLWNDNLAQSVDNDDLHDHYKWQMDQQMLVSGASDCLFVVSDGTENKMVKMFYARDEDRIKRLKAGWEQFDDDVQNYEHKQVKNKHTRVSVSESLPALVLKISGEVAETNLDVYKDKAFMYIDNINTNLVDDSHFIQAESDVKFCKSAESKIKLVKEQALAQTASIDTIFKTLDDISEYMRKTRLSLDKLVKTEKVKRSQDIINKATEVMNTAHQQARDEFDGKVEFSQQNFGFQQAVKGLRTIDSKQSAVDDQIARLKVELNLGRDRVRQSMGVIGEHEDYSFLLTDVQELAFMSEEILDLTIHGRIKKYNDKQEEMVEREKKRQANIALAKEQKRLEMAAREKEREERIASMNEQKRLEMVARKEKEIEEDFIESERERLEQQEKPPIPTVVNKVPEQDISDKSHEVLYDTNRTMHHVKEFVLLKNYLTLLQEVNKPNVAANPESAYILTKVGYCIADSLSEIEASIKGGGS